MLIPRRQLLVPERSLVTPVVDYRSTPFTTFAFPATGAPTSRTMPDRLAEISNVLDNGVTNNGVNSATALQTLVTNVSNAGGGTIFFPPGQYTWTTPITFNRDADFGIRFTGCGFASQIDCNFAGFVFDRSLGTPNNTYGPRVFDNLYIRNTHASGGCIRLGSTIGGGVSDCNLTSPFVCFTSEDAAGVSSQAIDLRKVIFGRSSGTTAVGLILGGSGTIQACDALSFAICMRLYGGGIIVDGVRLERSTTGIILGEDSDGTDRGLNGVSITGMPMEGIGTFIWIKGTTTGFHIGPNSVTGHDAGNSGIATATANTSYGIRIDADKAYSGEIVGLTPGQWFDVGAVYIEDYTTRSYVTISNMAPVVGGGAGVPWRLSTTTGGFKFINTSVTSSAHAPYGTRYSFANLTSPLEGDEYDIYDSNTTTIGATCTGSGASDARIRYNGSAWIVIPG